MSELGRETSVAVTIPRTLEQVRKIVQVISARRDGSTLHRAFADDAKVCAGGMNDANLRNVSENWLSAALTPSATSH